jgi:hypothetical protein
MRAPIAKPHYWDGSRKQPPYSTSKLRARCNFIIKRSAIKAAQLSVT